MAVVLKVFQVLTLATLWVSLVFGTAHAPSSSSTLCCWQQLPASPAHLRRAVVARQNAEVPRETGAAAVPALKGSAALFPAQREMYHGSPVYHAEMLRPDGTLDSDARLLRRVLVQDLGLKPRDIVALFSKDGRLGCDLNVRSGGILLSLGKDGPAVIVGEKAAWILPRGSPGRDMGKRVQQAFLEVATLALTSNLGAPVRRAGQDAGSVDDSPSPGSAREPALPADTLASVPFALAVTEALLVMFLDRLKHNLQSTTDEGASLLEGFASTGSAEINTFQLEVLRRTKQRLDYLRGQAKALQQTLFEALGDEDDLSRLARTIGATNEEWELCFEYYSQSAEEIGLEAYRQLEGLEDLERSISLRLSSRRLELEKLQLYLEVLGNGLSMGALLTGVFGMNLFSGLEMRQRTFWPVCVGIVLACAGVSGGLRWFVSRRLRRQGAAQLWSGRRPAAASWRRSSRPSMPV